ncbi:MAG: CZB domain-containing protein [SAR324 cluster bacterium]|nr:CZB domain-containing protein [SAR324 cluster bacterium]
MIEIATTRMEHIRWVEQIKAALQKGKLPQMANYCDCELGKWLDEQGKKKYGHLKEMQGLEEKHREFHQTADELIKLFENRNYDSAEIMLREFRRESKDLVFLLTMVEYRLNEINSP